MRKLTTELVLKAGAANRAADKHKQKVRDAGKETEKAGQRGERAFGGLAKGIGIASAAAVTVYGTLRMIHDHMVMIQSRAAEMFRMQQQRMRGAAVELGDPLYRQVFDVTGWTAQQARQRALGGVQRYDVTERGYLEAVKTIWARVPEGKREAMLRAAMTFGTGRGVETGVAGSTAALMPEQYGRTTLGGVQRGLAQVGAVAEKSAWTTGDFASQLTRVAPSLKGAGVVTLGDQLAQLSALSLSFPKSPELGGRALEMMANLAVGERQPFVVKLLRRAGMKGYTLNNIRVAMTKYLREGGETAINEISEQMNMPKRILRQIQKAATGTWEAKYRQGLELAEGATWEKDVQKRFGEWVAQPSVGERRAEAVGRQTETELGEPGSALESVRVLGRMRAGVKGTAGYQEEITRFGAEVLQQKGLDAPPSDEQIALLYELNQVYPRIKKGLQSIIRSGGPLAFQAGVLENNLTTAYRDANNWHFFGRQADYIPQYELAIRECIQFLRQLQLGQQIELRHSRWTGGPKSRSASRTQAAGASEALSGAADGGNWLLGTMQSTAEMLLGPGAHVNTMFVATPQDAAANNLTRTSQ